jgi:energy-coupling factor transport system permease protein
VGGEGKAVIGNITIGQYFPGQSMVHCLDPRTKIVSVLLFLTSLFIVDDKAGYGLVIVFTGIVAMLSQIPLNILIRGLKPLWWIILFTAGIHLFTTPGTPLWQWGSLVITEDGVRQGVFMTLRLVLLMLISSLLTLTTSPINLTDGIERLLSPLRPVGIPAHEIAMMMTIALRFIPTLLEETEKIVKAQTARGADFTSGNFITRATNMIPILVPLFINAFRRADDLAMAMEARCYRGGYGRTRMWELQMAMRDIVALMITGGLIVAVVLIRVYW